MRWSVWPAETSSGDQCSGDPEAGFLPVGSTRALVSEVFLPSTSAMIDPIVTVPSLVGVAAGVGFLHTLAGPDHYLPLLALSRSARWGAKKTMAYTVAFGVAHCVSSIVLALGFVAVLGRVPLEFLSGLGAWLMIGAGVVLLSGLWRGGAKRRRGAAVTLVGAAMLVGPCEWLVPTVLAAGHGYGVGTATMIGLAFTAATVLTMLGVVAIGVACTPKSRAEGESASGWKFRLVSEPVAGVVCVVCGALVLVGF